MVGSDFRDELTQLQGTAGEAVVADLLRYIQNVRKLNHILCAPYADLGELLQAYVECGCEIFGLETGIASHIVDDTYHVLKVHSPLDVLTEGMAFPLEATYCREVFEHQKTIAFEHIAHDERMREHPVYINLKLEAYLSTPIFVQGELYGTLNFTSREPRLEGFSVSEKDMIELMAQNIGNFIRFKRTSDKLHRKLYELERVNKDLDEFAYVVSHDLKAPLRGIGSLSGFLMQDAQENLAPEQQEYLKLIEEQVGRMDRLIDGVLRYTRAGKDGTDVSSFSLRELITEVGTALLKPENFTFIPPENDLVIDAERVKLEQVVMNLISNAIKHHDRADGTVQVSLSEEDGLACIAIVDDGPGIDPKYQERVFKVFEHLSRDKNSTGIGLAVVNKLVEDAGGHVTLNSAPGAGCTFTVYWPMG